MSRARWPGVLVALLWPTLAWSQITLLGTITTHDHAIGPGSSFTHTVAAGTNLLLVCAAMAEATGDNNTITSMTWNTTEALTFLVGSTTGLDRRAELWYRVAPTVTTGTIAATLAADPYFILSALNLGGVLQTTPTHTQSTTGAAVTTAALTLTSAANEFVVDCLAVPGADVDGTPDTDQTERVDHVTTDVVLNQFVSTMAGAASTVVPDWSWTGARNTAYVAVSLAPAPAAGPSGDAPPNPWVRPNCQLGHEAVTDATSYRWYVSATPGIVTPGTYVLEQSAPLTSARCPQLGLAVGMTRYLVVTAVNASGESPASNELWIMISSGTVDVRPP